MSTIAVDAVNPPSNTLTVGSTGQFVPAVGTTAERPTPVQGGFRFNTTTVKFEGYTGTAWSAVGGGACPATPTARGTVFGKSSAVTISCCVLTNGQTNLGHNAGLACQGGAAIAIGACAGNSIQGDKAIAIGYQAGSSSCACTVSIGASALASGFAGVSIGKSSFADGSSVAIGNSPNANIAAIAIGWNSCASGFNSIAIGKCAVAGGCSVAIGSQTSACACQTHIGPVRNATTCNTLYYNPCTREITYG